MSDAIDNCMDCPHHKVVPDPDKLDWFCDDDEAVLCGKMPNVHGDKAWKSGQRFSHAPVTVSCRPYRKRQESSAPKWCPLKVSQ